MNYLLFLFFGIAPSLLWLAYYLRKDTHPEPRQMIALIFIMGMVATIPAIVIELALRYGLELVFDASLPLLFFYMFAGVAFVEEFMKYVVFRIGIIGNSNIQEMDEPVDFIIYMIIAGLGFAAAENIIILLGLGPQAPLSEIVSLSALRLVGATFLHALASGAIGYFLALGAFRAKRKHIYLGSGLLLAAALHGFFNIYIIRGEGAPQWVFPVIILIGLALFTTFAFHQTKRMKSTTLSK